MDTRDPVLMFTVGAWFGMALIAVLVISKGKGGRKK